MSAACLAIARSALARQDGPIGNNDSATAIARRLVWEFVLTTSWQTVKYDTNGNALWTASFAATEGCASWPSAIAVDAHGNSYVTGTVCVVAACDELSCFESYSDYATIKYDPNGAQLWVARYNGSGSCYGFGTDGAASVAVDSSGNVHVTGTSYGPDSLLHYDDAEVRLERKSDLGRSLHWTGKRF